MTFKFIVAVSNNKIFEEWTGKSLIKLQGLFGFSKVNPVNFLDGIYGAVEKSTEDIIIIAHQDLKFNENFLLDLQNQLLGLNNWGICGVAGKDWKGESRSSVRFRDHCTGICGRTSAIPAEVQTLDELLLIFENGLGFNISSDILKFHLYGSDICLQSYKKHLKNYILNLKVEHRSMGGYIGDFETDKQNFQEKWGHLPFSIYSTAGQLK